MKILAAVLAALIVLIQYPLWLGKGGWARAWHVDQDLQNEKEKNTVLEQRNAAFAAEVRDLKQGTEAIEERARYELGMIRGDELFFQYADENRGQAPISPKPTR
jgi:cell division protein FtsB